MPDPAQIVRQSLLTAPMDNEPQVERVEVVRIELPPAQAAGLHLHPCPVVGCVISGAIRFQVAGEPRLTLQAGDAFLEPANVEIVHFDNASDEVPATFIAYYLLPPGEDRLIMML